MTPRELWKSGAVILSVALSAGLVLAGLSISPSSSPSKAGLDTGEIQHIIEIMMENHSFDNYFGVYPSDVDGLPENTSVPSGTGGVVPPYWIGASSTPSPPHDRTSEIADLDEGRMDGFVEQMALADPPAPDTPMGYYNATEIGGYWALAREFVLCDHYFASVLGPTVPNRMYAIAGSSAGFTEDSLPASGVSLPTIFDELSAYGLGWKYYYAPGGSVRAAPPVVLPSPARPGRSR